VNLFLLHFWGNTVFHAVSSLPACLPELSINQAQQVMRCYVMIVFTY